MVKLIQRKKGYISGHLAEGRNLLLRSSGKPNRLMTRAAKAKQQQKSGT